MTTKPKRLSRAQLAAIKREIKYLAHTGVIAVCNISLAEHLSLIAELKSHRVAERQHVVEQKRLTNQRNDARAVVINYLHDDERGLDALCAMEEAEENWRKERKEKS